jgi:hypothetical protein
MRRDENKMKALIIKYWLVKWPFNDMSVSRLCRSDDRMISECGPVGGNRNQVLVRKSAPVPFCTSQTPHDLTRDRTSATAVGS